MVMLLEATGCAAEVLLNGNPERLAPGARMLEDPLKPCFAPGGDRICGRRGGTRRGVDQAAASAGSRNCR